MCSARGTVDMLVSDQPSAHDIDQEPPTILVVDDEPSIREFLAWVLADEGFHVTTAGDGREALDVAKRQPPDVVLTDLMMPELDGYGLIDGLRRERIPVRAVIAMSAVNLSGDRTPPVDLFLAKPFEVEQMLAGVQALLDGRR